MYCDLFIAGVPAATWEENPQEKDFYEERRTESDF
jgi:hypothetical protein